MCVVPLRLVQPLFNQVCDLNLCTLLGVSALNVKVIYRSIEKNEINCVFADGYSLPSISLHYWACRDSTVNFPSAQPMVLKSVMRVN